MTLNLEAKKILLRKIPHGLFICGVRDEDKNEVNGFTAVSYTHLTLPTSVTV